MPGQRPIQGSVLSSELPPQAQLQFHKQLSSVIHGPNFLQTAVSKPELFAFHLFYFEREREKNTSQFSNTKWPGLKTHIQVTLYRPSRHTQHLKKRGQQFERELGERYMEGFGERARKCDVLVILKEKLYFK